MLLSSLNRLNFPNLRELYQLLLKSQTPIFPPSPGAQVRACTSRTVPLKIAVDASCLVCR